MALLAALTLPQVARGATLVVDPQGSDAESRGPFSTVARALALAEPGDTVVVNAGVYMESLVITRGGTESAPIILRGLPGAILTNPQPGVSHSAVDIRSGVAHFAVQGLELTGGFGEAVFLRPGTHDIELAGLEIHHNRAGIWIGGASKVSVRDSWIHHNFAGGIRLFGGARDIEIVDTRSENHDDGDGCSGDADGFSADATVSNVRLARVTASGNSEDGFDLKPDGVVLDQAIAKDNGCSGIKLGSGGALRNALIGGSRTGINVSGPQGARVSVEGCTLVDNATGIRALGDNYTFSVRNCIVNGPGKALTFASGVSLEEDHNIFYRPVPSHRLIVVMTAGGERLYSGDDVNAGRWAAESGQGVGTLSLDPLLDSATNELQLGGLGIDTGVDPGDLTHDLEGRSRPFGARHDRGALEWTPDPPIPVIRRALLRSRANGSGDLRLEVRLPMPPASDFDPVVDGVGLTLRGDRGLVTGLRVGGSELRQQARTPKPGGPWRLVYRQRSDPRCRLSVDLRDGQLIVRLRGDGADLWALGNGELSVNLQLGRIQARTSVTLSGVGRSRSFR